MAVWLRGPGAQDLTTIAGIRAASDESTLHTLRECNREIERIAGESPSDRRRRGRRFTRGALALANGGGEADP